MLNLVTVNNKTPGQLAFEIALDGERSESLSEYTAVTRLNPSALIERSLMRLDHSIMSNIMHTAAGIYISQYVQAIELSKNKGGVETVELLNKFSDDPRVTAKVALNLSGENWGEDDLQLPCFSGERRAEIDSDISKPANLAVGRLIHIPVGEGKDETTIPVNVTMSPREANLDLMIDIITNLSESRDLMSRWHRVWAGEIEFFKDFLFTEDIIKRERKLLLRDDEDGLYRASESRRTKGLISSIFSKERSLNVASNFLILSTTGAARLAAAGGGDISRYNSRKDIFRETGSMCLIVVNPIDERMQVYIRGFRKAANYTFEDIKSHSTNSNAMDINALMKAYNMGNS